MIYKKLGLAFRYRENRLRNREKLIFATGMHKIVHHSTVIYLSLVIGIRMMAMPISLLDYSLNKNFITSHFCENRARPELHCAGTCYLSKKLAKSGDNPDSQNQKRTGNITVVDFCETMEEPAMSADGRNQVHHSFIPDTRMDNPYAGFIFRPPIA